MAETNELRLNQFSDADAPVQTPASIAHLLPTPDAPPHISLYLHIPFCFHKCHYCDFYSIVDDRDRQLQFAQRMADEIRATAASPLPPIRTIFVGGGTPTLLAPHPWSIILDALHQNLDLSACIEFSVEANPETLAQPPGPELLTLLQSRGVNRLSIGAQSFNTDHLKTLERWHDPDNVPRAVQAARAAGIDNINLDLIYAIPHQTLDQWTDDLRAALALSPNHLSCYALTFEPNTPLTTKRDLGRIAPADHDLEAAMFQHTIDHLTAAGYEQYETSNFAQPNHRCQHNLAYWLNDSYLALGPSASGHLAGTRWKNTPHLGKYIASTGLSPVIDLETLSPEDSIGEQLMLRLRLTEGIPLQWIKDNVSAPRRQTLDRHAASGLIQYTDTHLTLTRPGQLLANTIIQDLI